MLSAQYFCFGMEARRRVEFTGVELAGEHASLAPLAHGPPEPPIPPTRAGLRAVVALLAQRQRAAECGKRSGRERCELQERRRGVNQQPDASYKSAEGA